MTLAEYDREVRRRYRARLWKAIAPYILNPLTYTAASFGALVAVLKILGLEG